MGNTESQGVAEKAEPEEAVARSPPEEDAADTRFRQLYRLLAQGNQREAAKRELEVLLEETRNGAGFLSRVARASSDRTLPELRVIQQCLLSDDEAIVRLVCRVLAALRPDSTHTCLWFGITPEHAAWARLHARDVQAQRVIALGTLCTPSIVEDVRSLAVADASRETRLVALEALACLLLHPENRTSNLFSERDVRYLSDWPSISREEDVPLKRLSLEVLEAWSLSWSPDAFRKDGADWTSAKDTANSSPPSARALAYRLSALVVEDGASSELSEIAIRILYHLNVSDVEERLVKPLTSALTSSPLASQARFFVAMLLLRVADSNPNALHPSAIEGIPLAGKKPITPDDLALRALLACVCSFARFDADLHAALVDSHAIELQSDESMRAFLYRLVARSVCVTCASVFASRYAATALLLPRSVALSYVVALEHHDERAFALIARVLARPESREFAIQAVDNSAALFFQNAAAHFMYPDSEETRSLAIRCLQQLVAGFAAHDLGWQRNFALYEFFLARVREAEELHVIGAPGDAFNDSKSVKLLVSEYLFYSRMGLALCFRPGDVRCERGPFLDEASQRPDADRTVLEAAGDEHSGSAREDIEVHLRIWTDCAPMSAFIERVINLFFGDDTPLRFGALRTLLALTQTNEGARRAICQLVLGRLSSNLKHDELALLLGLATRPGGASIWIDPSEPANRAGSDLDVCVDGTSMLISRMGEGDPFRVGASLVHCEQGLGVVVRAEATTDAQATVEVAFDSGTYITLPRAELALKARTLDGRNTEADAAASGWTFLARTDAAGDSDEMRILAQAANGDVLVGVFERRIGCYDAGMQRWHASGIFLASDKPQTILVTARDRRTTFYVMDDSFRVSEVSAVDFACCKPPLCLFDGLEGRSAFPGVLQLAFFPTAWPERDVGLSLALFDAGMDGTRAVLARHPGLIARIVAKLQTRKDSAHERRLAADLLHNIALCPFVRLELIQALGPALEGFLSDESTGFMVEVGSQKPLLDWHAHARLLCALA